jgi:hypothetical protein
MPKKITNMLKDEKYIKPIEEFISKDNCNYKTVYKNGKKYKETSIEVPSYEYAVVDLIIEYLEKKADFVEPIYNYKNNWDYCTIFIHKLIE